MSIKTKGVLFPTPDEIEDILENYKPDNKGKDFDIYVLLQRLYVISSSFLSDRNNINIIDVSNLDRVSSKKLNEKFPYLGNFCFARWMQNFVYNPSQALGEISTLLEKVKNHYLITDNFILRREKKKFLSNFYNEILNYDINTKEQMKEFLYLYLYKNSIYNFNRVDLSHNKYLDKIFCSINDYGICYRDFYILYKEYNFLEKNTLAKNVFSKIINMLVYFHNNPIDLIFENINLAKEHFVYASKIRDQFFKYGIYKMEFSSVNIIALINEYTKFPGGAHSSICYAFMDMERRFSKRILNTKDCVNLYDEIIFNIEFSGKTFSKESFLNHIELKISELEY